MKHEWRKKEKRIYLPNKVPGFIKIPGYKFFTIKGSGNPNNDFFQAYVKTLYSLSYAIKMSPKKGVKPIGYFDYTVYPLEGIWDIKEEAKKTFQDKINEDDLFFKLMIRQPDFVNKEVAEKTIYQVNKKTPNRLLEKVEFEKITDGECIQMMHIGSYDIENESFKLMEEFAEKKNFLRISKDHKEIYLSDPRKVSQDKLKTVLRFRVKSK